MYKQQDVEKDDVGFGRAMMQATQCSYTFPITMGRDGAS